MHSQRTLSAKITDAAVAAVAFAAGGAIFAPVVLVAIFPFAG